MKDHHLDVDQNNFVRSEHIATEEMDQTESSNREIRTTATSREANLTNAKGTRRPSPRDNCQRRSKSIVKLTIADTLDTSQVNPDFGFKTDTDEDPRFHIHS
jgi:hypothetical protein